MKPDHDLTCSNIATRAARWNAHLLLWLLPFLGYTFAAPNLAFAGIGNAQRPAPTATPPGNAPQEDENRPVAHGRGNAYSHEAFACENLPRSS